MARDPSPEVTGGVREAYKIRIPTFGIRVGKGLKGKEDLFFENEMNFKSIQATSLAKETWQGFCAKGAKKNPKPHRAAFAPSTVY